MQHIVLPVTDLLYSSLQEKQSPQNPPSTEGGKGTFMSFVSS